MFLKCQLCPQVSCTVNTYVNHCKSHRGRASTKFQIPCSCCNIVLTNRTSFFKHFSEAHKDKKCEKKAEALFSLLCSHCFISFPNVTEFKIHAKSFLLTQSLDCLACHVTDNKPVDTLHKHFSNYHGELAMSVYQTKLYFHFTRSGLAQKQGNTCFVIWKISVFFCWEIHVNLTGT